MIDNVKIINQHRGAVKYTLLACELKQKSDCGCVEGKFTDRRKREAEGGGLDWMSNAGLGKGITAQKHLQKFSSSWTLLDSGNFCCF